MFLCPHKMKMSHHFLSLWYPLELETFLISEDPPHPPILNFSQVSPLFSLESFPKLVYIISELT